MEKSALIPVIDLFAGPGGLGEGFSAFETKAGHRPFQLRLSIEKDDWAHKTLRLRSFFRQFSPGDAPGLYYDLLRQKFPLSEFSGRLKAESPACWEKWQAADIEAIHAELGASDDANAEMRKRIKDVLGNSKKHWVLIGGPPCQAYSVVGRSRNRGNLKYRIEKDQRSSLYREYLRIIAEHWPTVFVMENVKGLLSATVQDQGVFEQILRDLQSPLAAPGYEKQVQPSQRYRIIPVVQRSRPLISNLLPPTDFIVTCEKYGIPQVRHRLILVGVREDLGQFDLPHLNQAPGPTVRDIIGGLPRLRSGLSRKRVGDAYEKLPDNLGFWQETIVKETIRNARKGERGWLKTRKMKSGSNAEVRSLILKTVNAISASELGRGAEFIHCLPDLQDTDSLRPWYIDERLGGICNHESRTHLDRDLTRYLFAACYAQVHGESPKLDRFPAYLQPEHLNADTGHFDDRFRVQLADRPSTTITSHISKDGHYFIHPDPTQCRSLTVREAARLQTFPDNYFFCGPRTAQYTQVGNAVPPLLARQIADCIWQFLLKTGEVA